MEFLACSVLQTIRNVRSEVCVIITGERSLFIVCDGLNSLPHLSGVCGVMEEAQDFLGMGLFYYPDGTLGVGSG